MSDALDRWHRQKTAAITAMLGVSLVAGVVITAVAPDAAENGIPLGIQIAANVVMIVLGLHWLQADSAQLDIRRPVWLNVGIVLLAAVFVPYYFYKTRPAGARLHPILAFFGLIFACAMTSAIGTLLMGAIQPGSAPPATF